MRIFEIIQDLHSGEAFPKFLYHFTTVKKIITILETGQLIPGANGRVSFTDDPQQALFRYMPVVMKFDCSIYSNIDFTRYKGDAAMLAGGDEREFYATEAVPLFSNLLAIFIRPNAIDYSATDFRSTFGMTKKEFGSRLKSLRDRGVKVTVTDFNDSDTTWFLA